MPDELLSHNEKDLRSKIYTIRGLQVMLDFDLAEIYGYEVKRLNEQVKRNIERFPEDFMFQLTRDELDILKSQFATSSFDPVKSQFATSPKDKVLYEQWGGTRKLPYAFTEQGVYMLATVLHGTLAEQQSIFIMRAFRNLKHYVQENLQFVTRNELQLLTHSVLAISEQNISFKEKQKQTDEEIKKIYESIKQINNNFIEQKDLKNFVIYKGQKFEADVAYVDIYKLATKSIYVIDDYVDIKTLNLLKHKKIGIQIILFTQNGHGKKGFLTSSEVQDFNSQFGNLILKPNPDCHDRFIVLDYNTPDEKVYHCGASSKDAGKKVCAINKFENTSIIHPIIDKLIIQKDLVIS
ncbi:MAG: ORF6N domain-containing protein [Treponema sp.]|nr:ORF6N domain-containing protein [Treponema sp.]